MENGHIHRLWEFKIHTTEIHATEIHATKIQGKFAHLAYIYTRPCTLDENTNQKYFASNKTTKTPHFFTNNLHDISRASIIISKRFFFRIFYKIRRNLLNLFDNHLNDWFQIFFTQGIRMRNLCTLPYLSLGESCFGVSLSPSSVFTSVATGSSFTSFVPSHTGVCWQLSD